MDQDNIDKLNNLNDALTALDIAEGAIKDKVLSQKIGTSSTGRYGVLAAGFGIGEQLAIWNKSEKSIADFERLAVGLGTNVPHPLSLLLVPKKAFDDNFDQGAKEAENLKGLLNLSKRLDSAFRFGDKSENQPTVSNAENAAITAKSIVNVVTKTEDRKMLTEAQVLANIKANRSPDGKESMNQWVQDSPTQGHSWHKAKDGMLQHTSITFIEGGGSVAIVSDFAKGATVPKQEQRTIRSPDGKIVADIMIKANANGQMEGTLIDSSSHPSLEKGKPSKQHKSQNSEPENLVNSGQLAASSVSSLKIAQDIPENRRELVQNMVDTMIAKHNLIVAKNEKIQSATSALV